jgi:hypothetical protein
MSFILGKHAHPEMLTGNKVQTFPVSSVVRRSRLPRIH